MTERRFTIEEIAKTLLDPDLDRVAQSNPVRVNSNVCFVVDTSQLKHKQDYKADDMGVWVNNRVDTNYFICWESNGSMEIDRVQQSDEGAFQLKRRYYKHGSEPSLRKITSSIIGESAESDTFCMLQQCFSMTQQIVCYIPTYLLHKLD